MNFNGFINNLKRDNDFNVDFKVSLPLSKEFLKNAIYPYPYENYCCRINIDIENQTLSLIPCETTDSYEAKYVVELFESSFIGLSAKVNIDLTNMTDEFLERFNLTQKIYKADDNPFIDSSYSEKSTMISFDIAD